MREVFTSGRPSGGGIGVVDLSISCLFHVKGWGAPIEAIHTNFLLYKLACLYTRHYCLYTKKEEKGEVN
jgi:hypothetical protein